MCSRQNCAPNAKHLSMEWLTKTLFIQHLCRGSPAFPNVPHVATYVLSPGNLTPLVLFYAHMADGCYRQMLKYVSADIDFIVTLIKWLYDIKDLLFYLLKLSLHFYRRKNCIEFHCQQKQLDILVRYGSLLCDCDFLYLKQLIIKQIYLYPYIFKIQLTT